MNERKPPPEIRPDPATQGHISGGDDLPEWLWWAPVGVFAVGMVVLAIVLLIKH